MMKSYILTLILTMTSIVALSQYRYSVETCWNLAKNNYPSIKHLDLIRKSRDYSLSNADMTILPTQIDAFAYTSNVENKVKKIEKEPIKKNTSFLDNFIAKKSVKTNLPTSSQSSLQTNLYTLNERINNLYFSLILIDKKIKLNELLQLQLIELYKSYASKSKTNTKTILGAIESLQKVAKSKYSLIRTQQQLYFSMLSIMTGKAINEKSILIEPSIERYIRKTAATNDIELINNKNYNPFKTSVIPQIKISNNDFLPENDFKVFDVAKIAPKTVTKIDYNINTNNMFSLGSKQQETERTEINQLNEQINQDENLLTKHNQIVLITYNKVLKGDTDISNLIQDILIYDNLHHSLAAHKVQLMMSINKFRFLYEK